MATWGLTSFTEYCGERAPDEQFTLDMGRAVRKLDVTPGTVTARQQAVADFLGYNKVVSVSSQDNSHTIRYISRGTPLPYTFASTNPSLLPAQQYQYAANIVRGEALAPNGTTRIFLEGGPVNQAGNIGVGGNFVKYRYTTEFTTRNYDIHPDSAVLAQDSSLNGDDEVIIGFFPPSPLFDGTGAGPGIGYPDEGQLLSGRAFTTFPGWPPPSPPKFSIASRYVTRMFRPSSQLRVLPFGFMYWFSDGKPIRQGVAIQESAGLVCYNWWFVPEDGVPLEAIQNAGDTVNRYWFDGFPPTTLLFKDMNLSRFIGPLGDVLYNLEYIFSWRPNRSKTGSFRTPTPLPKGFPLGWNSQLRVKQVAGKNVMDYDGVVDDPTNAFPNDAYDDFDFSNLFRPDQP